MGILRVFGLDLGDLRLSEPGLERLDDAFAWGEWLVERSVARIVTMFKGFIGSFLESRGSFKVSWSKETRVGEGDGNAEATRDPDLTVGFIFDEEC